MNNNMPRKKGFSLLSFLLGILLGMILLIGMVGGVILYVLNGKIDDVMNMVDVPNRDEDGNNIYINTDKDNGGVETLLQLLTRVGGFFNDTQNLTVGEVENLIPAVGDMVDQVCVEIGKYVEIDRAELVATPFSGFGDYVQAKVMDIQPAALLGNLGFEGTLDNKIISLLLVGKEAYYVENDGVKYPVYYDIYKNLNGVYVREGDGVVLDSSLEANLVEMQNAFRLYYYAFNGAYYVTDDTFAFAPAVRSASAYVPSENGKLSGNYYFEGDKKVTVTPVTLRDFSSGKFEMLNDIYLSDLFEGNTSDVADKIMSGICIGDIFNGKFDFNDVLNGLTLADIVKVSVDDSLMMNFVYGVSEVTAVQGHTYTHKGTYKDGEIIREVFIETELSENAQKVKHIYYLSEEENISVNGITLGELMNDFSFDEIMDGIYVSDLVKVKADDSIMMSLVYKVGGIKTVDGQSYTHIGTYDDGETERKVFIETETTADGVVVKKVYYTENEEEVVIRSLTVKDLMTNLNFDEILANISLADVLDGVSVSDAIMVKLVYKVGGITEVSGFDYTHTGTYTDDEGIKHDVFIETSEGNIKAIYYIVDGERIEVKSVSVNDLTSGLDFNELMSEFTVADFIDVKADDKLIAYIAYGLYDVDVENMTAKVEIDGVEYSCVIVADAENNITEVYTVDQDGNRLAVVEGTALDSISTGVNGIMDKLKIGDIIDVGENKMLNAIKDTTLNGLADKIDTLKIGDIIDPADNKLLNAISDFTLGTLATDIETLTIGQIVDTGDNKLLNAISGATLSTLPEAISNLTLSQIMDTEDNFLLKNLSDTTIEGLPAAILEIKINTLYAKDVYGTDAENPYEADAVGFNENYLYYELNEKGRYTLVNGDGKLNVEEFTLGTANGNKYYTYGAAKGIWKTLLCENGNEAAYTLENLNGMIDNVAKNISTSTLRDLVEIGVLDLSEEQLEKQIYYYDSASHQFKPSEKLGDMELTELIKFIIDNITTRPEIPGIGI